MVIRAKKRKQPRQYFWNSKTNCMNLLHSLTGKTLEDIDNKYSMSLIRNSKNHRLMLIKSLDSDIREIVDFRNNQLIPTKMAIEDMLEIIDGEIETAKHKKDMIKR